jgi:2'-5' RNA ligase
MMLRTTQPASSARDEARLEARLFVAVPISDKARQALARLSADLQKGFQFTPCRPSWGRPETMHLTLAFLGKKPRATIEPMNAALARVAARFAPLVVEIKGLGVFPHWRRPRVLWVGMRERTHQLDALHESIEHCLEPFDYEPEAREYHPHFTLARFTQLRGLEAARSIVEAHKDFRAPAFDAATMALFESQLHPEGARHTVLNAFAFSKGNDHAEHGAS